MINPLPSRRKWLFCRYFYKLLTFGQVNSECEQEARELESHLISQRGSSGC